MILASKADTLMVLNSDLENEETDLLPGKEDQLLAHHIEKATWGLQCYVDFPGTMTTVTAQHAS